MPKPGKIASPSKPPPNAPKNVFLPLCRVSVWLLRGLVREVDRLRERRRDLDREREWRL